MRSRADRARTIIMRVVITGANRGIGLELTRQYLARGAAVEATARHPDQAAALSAMAAVGELRIHPLDVTDDASVKAFGRALGDDAVDVLINNAGIYGSSDRLDRMDFAEMLRTLDTNAVGALRVTSALLDALRRGKAKKVASITSGLGSIGDNTSGGSYGYRMSKAALNMAMRSLSVDLKKDGITVVAVNPGWVQTDMGGARATPVAESAGNIIALLDRIGLAESGQLPRSPRPHLALVKTARAALSLAVLAALAACGDGGGTAPDSASSDPASSADAEPMPWPTSVRTPARRSVPTSCPTRRSRPATTASRSSTASATTTSAASAWRCPTSPPAARSSSRPATPATSRSGPTSPRAVTWRCPRRASPPAPTTSPTSPASSRSSTSISAAPASGRGSCQPRRLRPGPRELRLRGRHDLRPRPRLLRHLRPARDRQRGLRPRSPLPPDRALRGRRVRRAAPARRAL
ncbi:MAG: SDR family oxidoreductase [Myxococcota bacterium]